MAVTGQFSVAADTPPDGQSRAAGAARAEQFDLQPRHIPVIGAQLRPTIKRPNTRASLLPAAPS
jgi:hypothetical protein